MRIVAALLLISSLFSTHSAEAAPGADVWDVWQKSNPESEQKVDHQAWQNVLDNYLVASEDGINRVRYEALGAEGRAELTGYLDALQAIDPRELNPNEQMAYWINLYNAMTLETVLRFPKKKSILRMGEKFFSVGPWNDKVMSIAGFELTLNDVEHRILRPIWQDHRIHYAVNCASIGCPNLSTTAYTGDNLEAQLQAAEQGYLAHDRGVSLNDKGTKLQLSQIYEWYRSDFAEDEAGLIAHLAERHPDGERLRNFAGRVSYDYDWGLNTAEKR